MKKLFTLIIGILLITTGYSQINIWANTPFDYQSWTGGGNSTYGSDMSIVSDKVAWMLFNDIKQGGETNETVTLLKVALTTDGGATWETFNGPGDTGSGYSMIHAIDDKKAWIPVFNTDKGLHYTEDGGKSWNKVSEIYTGENSFCNVVYFWDEKNGFAQGDPLNDLDNFEIYYTTDGGTSWTPVSGVSATEVNENGTVGFYDVALDGTLYWTTTKGRVFITTDKGVSFDVKETGLTDEISIKPGIVVIDEKTAIVCAYSKDKDKHSYKITEDAGNTWKDWTPLGAGETFGSYDFCNVPGTDILVSVSPILGDPEPTPFISYCEKGRSGEEWDRFYQWTTEGAPQVLYVKFEERDGNLIGYATTYNYGGTYNGPQGILRYFGTLPPPQGTDVKNIQGINVNVYPNPTSGIINIQTVEEIKTITLTDISGKTVKEINNPEKNTVLDIQNCNKGFYILSIKTTDNKIINKKIILK